MPRVETHMKIFFWKMKSSQGILIYLKILKSYKKKAKQEDLQWSPLTRGQGELDHQLLEDTPWVVRCHLKRFQLKPEATQKNTSG
jgi:hypothetical protein